MGTFWTEKEIEEWVTSETRILILPDGIKRPFTGYKLMWSIHDDLVWLGGYSPKQLIGWAVQETELSGVSFEKTFPAIIAYVDKHVRNLRGSR